MTLTLRPLHLPAAARRCRVPPRRRRCGHRTPWHALPMLAGLHMRQLVIGAQMRVSKRMPPGGAARQPGPWMPAAGVCPRPNLVACAEATREPLRAMLRGAWVVTSGLAAPGRGAAAACALRAGRGFAAGGGQGGSAQSVLEAAAGEAGVVPRPPPPQPPPLPVTERRSLQLHPTAALASRRRRSLHHQARLATGCLPSAACRRQGARGGGGPHEDPPRPGPPRALA